MTQQARVNKAVEIACRAHSKQVDKGGADYILHPLHVMMQMDTEDEMIVAVLHDVLEDNPEYSTDILIEKGIREDLVNQVKGLTKQPGESYTNYIKYISVYPIAKKVKIADLKHNLDTTRLTEPLTEKDINRLIKYTDALNFLYW